MKVLAESFDLNQVVWELDRSRGLLDFPVFELSPVHLQEAWLGGSSRSPQLLHERARPMLLHSSSEWSPPQLRKHFQYLV